MKKVKWVNLPIQNENDCWTHALSYALDVSYDDIRIMFDKLKYKDGTLAQMLTRATLESNGFGRLDLEQEWDVLNCLRAFNSYDSKIILQIENHVMYIDNNTIYSSNPSEDSYYNMLSDKVISVYMKPKF